MANSQDTRLNYPTEMKDKAPRVSVLMSVYNTEKYIAQAVESILNQTFKDFEFIIFEDCSTDNSLEILREFALKDTRIHLIENSSNKGLTANLFDGMNKAKGTYLARMDADDISLPNRFEEQVNYLEIHKNVSLLGTAVIFFDDYDYEFIAYQPLEHDEIKVELLVGYTMLHPSVMMRLKDFRKHNLNYDKSFRYSQDHDLWVRAIQKLRFANLGDAQIKMREHVNKISTNLKPQQKILSDRVRKWQLEKLGVKFNYEELEVFNAIVNGVDVNNPNKIKLFESALLKIISANKINLIYNQVLLENICANKFKDLCRQQLVSGNSSGLYFWQSHLKKYGQNDFKNNLGLAYRSLKSFFVKA